MLFASGVAFLRSAIALAVQKIDVSPEEWNPPPTCETLPHFQFQWKLHPSPYTSHKHIYGHDHTSLVQARLSLVGEQQPPRGPRGLLDRINWDKPGWENTFDAFYISGEKWPFNTNRGKNIKFILISNLWLIFYSLINESKKR